MTDVVEEWLPVSGYQGLYEVSNCGHVRSLTRYRTNRNGVRRLCRGVQMSPGHRRTRHQYVGLSNESGKVYRSVHVLVLEAFVGPAPAGLECRHRDGDPDNNVVGNLVWGSRSDNVLDAVHHGTHPMAKKTHCPQGHGYTPGNTLRVNRNARRCKTCHYAAVEARRLRKLNDPPFPITL